MRRQIRPEQLVNYTAITPMTAQFRRPATCEEAGCAFWPTGFQICVEPDDERAAMRIAALRTAGRNHGEFLVVAGNVQQVTLEGVSSGEINTSPLAEQDGTWFVFPAGERCFRSHTVLNGADPLFQVGRGARRGGTDTRHGQRTVDGDEWKERFNESTDAITRAVARG